MPKMAPNCAWPVLQPAPRLMGPRIALTTLPPLPSLSAFTSISSRVSTGSHVVVEVHVRAVTKPMGAPLFAMKTMSPETPHGSWLSGSTPRLPTMVGLPLDWSIA